MCEPSVGLRLFTMMFDNRAEWGKFLGNSLFKYKVQISSVAMGFIQTMFCVVTCQIHSSDSAGVALISHLVPDELRAEVSPEWL